MDPFTQRMLERARARQAKIDQKLASTGQSVRKPLSENISAIKSASSPSKTKEAVLSPKNSIKESANTTSPVKSSARRSNQKADQSKVLASPIKPKSDVIVTKKEFRGIPKRNSINRRDSDVSVEINIMHRDDIMIEVQVEERDAPINLVYGSNEESNGVVIHEIEDDTSKRALDQQLSDMAEHKNERAGLRNKSRLDRLGNLYSDTPNLSSPIHRTEQSFSSATPPLFRDETPKPKPTANKDGKKKFGRLAALADQINNWEDDLSHHSHHLPEPTKKPVKKQAPTKDDKHDASTLDVSIHSINDINKVLSTAKSTQSTKPSGSRTFTKPGGVQLEKSIVAQLVSARLVNSRI